MPDLTVQEVKQMAAEIGFDLCGVARPEIIPEAKARFAEWLTKGNHAGAGYLARNPERRSDPKLVLPEAKSVIMLGLNYFQSNAPDCPSGHGRVSRYARGKDYHRVAQKKMARLIERICMEIDAANRPEFHPLVDYGPLLERTLAVKAGLGSLGRNSMLINERFGSWLFLCAILTSIELEEDRPGLADYSICGDCRLCLQSCPTGAIGEEGSVDSRRCISYLTVEEPFEIGPETAPLLGSRLFGCDTCQEVCPLNSQAVPTGHEEFRPDAGVGEFLDLGRLLSLENKDQFLDLAAGIPLTRPGLEGIQQTARIVLDNESAQK